MDEFKAGTALPLTFSMPGAPGLASETWEN
jgi:hypothetical protein